MDDGISTMGDLTKNRVRIVVTTLVIATLGVAIWFGFVHGKSESLFQGKPASYWVRTLGDPSIDPSTTWSTLGPEVVPYLAGSLGRQNSPIARAYLKLWPHQPQSLQKHLPRPVDARVVRRNAALGLFCWNASGTF